MGTFVDIFAGCGGLSLGLMQAGWQGLFAIEKDANAFETLETNFLSPNSKHSFLWPDWLPKRALSVTTALKEYRSQLAALAGTVDMLVGGPPCQGFSNAGRRNPADPRNRLVKAYLRFVKILKPRIVLMENVRGITSDFADAEAVGGKTNYAAWLKSALAKEYVVHTQTLDTSKFGVPQRRQRFFVIATRKDLPCPFKGCPFQLIEKERDSFLQKKGLPATPIGSRSAISDLEVRKNGRIPCADSLGFEAISYRGPETSFQKIMNAGADTPLPDTRLAKHNTAITARFKKIIKHCHESGRLNTSLSAEMRASLGLKKCAIRVLDPDSPSPTITSMPDDLIHYNEPRALTVRETARLQSFPDWFCFKGKYTTGGHRRRKEIPRFTQVANAVPPLVAEALGMSLGNALTISPTKSR